MKKVMYAIDAYAIRGYNSLEYVQRIYPHYEIVEYRFNLDENLLKVVSTTLDIFLLVEPWNVRAIRVYRDNECIVYLHGEQALQFAAEALNEYHDQNVDPVITAREAIELLKEELKIK